MWKPPFPAKLPHHLQMKPSKRYHNLLSVGQIGMREDEGSITLFDYSEQTLILNLERIEYNTLPTSSTTFLRRPFETSITKSSSTTIETKDYFYLIGHFLTTFPSQLSTCSAPTRRSSTHPPHHLTSPSSVSREHRVFHQLYLSADSAAIQKVGITPAETRIILHVYHKSA